MSPINHHNFCIFFDVDDTLYDRREPYETAFRESFPQYAYLDMVKLFDSSQIHSDEFFHALQDGKITMEEMCISRIKRTVEDFAITISDQEACDFQKRYEYHQRHIHTSALCKEMLDFVKAHFRMGIITNGPKDHQWDKIHDLKLLNWIPEEHIFVSGELGVAKPHREIFDIAREKLDLPPESCYFVGDSFANDIVGAKAAGWKSIWYNRRNKEIPESPTSDYIVETEEELFDAIRNIK